MRAIAVAAALAAAALLRRAAAQRPPPVWPAAVSGNFSETTSDVIASYNTTGAWYYDYGAAGAQPRQRIDRATGKYDRFCGSVDSVDAPCSHLVRDGVRYLVWPTLSKCCGCCTAAQGCGVVRPTWMRDSNGTWQGTAPFKSSLWSGSADSWEITGAQPNYWFTISGGDVPVGFAQVPDDYQYFQPSTWAPGPQDDALFALPSYCTPKCSGINTCTLV
jgi:hypothetical protein